MTERRDPSIEPAEGSRIWVSSPPEAIEQNIDDSVLMIRLGLALNSLIAQHRETDRIAQSKEAGAAHMRDLLWSFVTAASYTKESLNILTGLTDAPGQFGRVKELALAGSAPPELLEKLGRICGGAHPATPVLNQIRNKLGFHWDPTIVRASLIEFTQNKSVIWAEAADRSRRRDLVYRLASDVLANAIVPNTEPEPEDQEERQRRAEQRMKDALRDVVDAMDTIIEVFQYATKGFWSGVPCTQHER